MEHTYTSAVANMLFRNIDEINGMGAPGVTKKSDLKFPTAWWWDCVHGEANMAMRDRKGPKKNSLQR
jgi:hypothetical protein